MHRSVDGPEPGDDSAPTSNVDVVDVRDNGVRDGICTDKVGDNDDKAFFGVCEKLECAAFPLLLFPELRL